MARNLTTNIQINFKEVALILGFGGFGGLLSVVYSKTLGQPLPSQGWWILPASILLGMGASFIGVYVIANCDTQALMRCLGFALLCGISWKPVYDAGNALISQQVKEKQVTEATEKIQKASEATAHLSVVPPAQATAQVEAATKITAEALHLARSIGDAEVLDKANKAGSELYLKSVNLEATGAITKEVASSTRSVLENLSSLPFHP